jgi:hypothetical protein
MGRHPACLHSKNRRLVRECNADHALVLFAAAKRAGGAEGQKKGPFKRAYGTRERESGSQRVGTPSTTRPPQLEVRSAYRLSHSSARHSITMQVGALGIEPSLGSLVIRKQSLHDTPESCRMVHFDQMRHFMRGEIIEHVARRQNKPP